MTVAPLSLEHLLRPSSLKEGKPPALFMFHGYGSNEEDLFSFADDLPDQFCIVSVRAPHALQPFGYAWYTINFEASYGKWSDVQQARKSRDLIMEFIDEACKAYQLETENISLLGFSQGTVLCYALALSYPKRFRNIIALSGYIDEQTLVENYREKDHSPLKVYASHGQMDMVIPPEWAQKTPAFMEKLGIEYLYEEFPVGHGVSPGNFESFLKWLKGRL
jgi:phospholipase/carboxylesterase